MSTCFSSDRSATTRSVDDLVEVAFIQSGGGGPDPFDTLGIDEHRTVRKDLAAGIDRNDVAILDQLVRRQVI